MTTEEIKAKLKEKKLTERALAKRLGVSKSSVHFFIHRTFTSKRMERGFARVLGVTKEQLRGGGNEKQAVGE